MAEEEEKNKSGGGDHEDQKKSGEGGGDEKRWVLPPGFRFTPSDEELVTYYLLPKLQGREYVPNDAIIEADVYKCHPDRLIDMHKHKGENSWYFLSPRFRKYQNGDRPSRNTDDNRGRWKASTGKSEVKEVAGDGKTKFCESVLAYFEGPIKTERKTKWLMHELTIPEYENKLDKSGGSSDNKTLDEYVMCKIYVTPRHRGKNDDEAGPSGTCQEACPPPQPGPAMESGQATAAQKLLKKRAGKRPAEEQPHGCATTPKLAHKRNLHLGPPPPLPYYGGGAPQVPFRSTGYYGGAERSTAYDPRTPMPRPPVAYNGQTPVAFNDQLPVQRQTMAFNGQVPAQRQPVALNGQVPAQRQPGAFNGQVTAQQQPMAFNGQVPVQRQPGAFNSQVRPQVLKQSPPYRGATGTPNSCGQGQTMMTRSSSNPAGQEAMPPSVPGPPQVQKQEQEQPAETAEMRKKRVYLQHVDEWRRMQMQQRQAAFMQQQQQQAAFMQQQQQQQQRVATVAQHQQQQRLAALAQQQQEQQPCIGAGVNHHHVGATAPQFPPYDYQVGQQYQCNWVVPATSDSGGATAPASAEASVSGAGNEGSGQWDGNNDEENNFVDYLATIQTSSSSSGRSSSANGDVPPHDSPQ